MFSLIPAAGSGSRAATDIPKQYAPLAGRSMLWHAIRAVCVPPVQAVFVVLSPDDATFATHDWSAFGDRLQPLYCGGESRRHSVHNGLVAAMDDMDAGDWVLVHDAARPCLGEADVKRLIAACENDDVGGILALPVADTVKPSAVLSIAWWCRLLTCSTSVSPSSSCITRASMVSGVTQTSCAIAYGGESTWWLSA